MPGGFNFYSNLFRHKLSIEPPVGVFIEGLACKYIKPTTLWMLLVTICPNFFFG